MQAFTRKAIRNTYPFTTLKILHSIGIFIAFLSIGMGIIVFQSLTNEAERINESIIIAKNFLDSNISDANRAALTALNHASEDCNIVKPLLDFTILDIPSIMSISVIHKNQIICSSFEPNIGRFARSSKREGLTLLESRYTVPVYDHNKV